VIVKGHSEYVRLLSSMRTVASRARSWSGVVYRSAPPRWSVGRDMLTGAGSMKSGARFNAPGSFPAVYGSTTPELAMIESLAYQRRAGLPVERTMPLVFKAIRVQVERLLDLTDVAILAELGILDDRLRTEPWWQARARGEESLTQALGRAANACGLQGLRAASANSIAHGHNMIIIPGNIHPPSAMKFLRRSS
jgi:RES domain-containing protein